VRYAKITIATCTIKANAPIINGSWNDVNRELSFNSSGVIVTDVGDMGQPTYIKVDGTTYTNWTYNSTLRQVIVYNVHGKVILQWKSSGMELWLIAAFSIGLTIVTATVLLKKGNVVSFLTKQRFNNF
jgi:hypothetical protein